MDELESLNHSKWECKYHIVFIPKCRRKTLYVRNRSHPVGQAALGNGIFGCGAPVRAAAMRSRA